MARSEPYETKLIQYGLMARGFPLPRFGADGIWGDESQQAYDLFVALVEGSAVTNCVVDLSHHNDPVDFAAARTGGIIGVIHKATQGFRYTDPTYEDRKAAALAAGLLWGAYHFGVGGDGMAQAEYFLSLVCPTPGDLLVLDLEPNPGGSSMSIDEAEEFVEKVFAETGRWPGLYSGSYIKEKLGTNPNTILTNCWLWLAQYGNRAELPAGWDWWTMWQYTDGIAGPEPHSVEGIGPCDRDKFNGDQEALAAFWLSPAG